MFMTSRHTFDVIKTCASYFDVIFYFSVKGGKLPVEVTDTLETELGGKRKTITLESKADGLPEFKCSKNSIILRCVSCPST